MEILTTDRLTKTYKGRPALTNVSMHVEEGDIYGFVGENGAGKTTLIRLITGLSAPTSGTFTLFGAKSDSPEIYEARKKIAAMVEAPSMNLNMTAVQNLEQQCLIVGLKKTADEIHALLDRVGLPWESVEKKKVSNFSLGMRQRLGIAMMLVPDSRFLILDEPMNGLDPQGFIEVRETIMKLHDEGVTFLISSHILAELEKICNRIGFISAGVLIQEVPMSVLHEFAGKRIVIGADDASRIEAVLRAKLGMTELSSYEGEVTIPKADNYDINVILKAILDEGLTVRSVNMPEETVEDYYVKLMRRARRQ